MNIMIHGTEYRFELYEDNGGHRHLFAFLSSDDEPVAGFCGTYNETADAIRDMLSDDPAYPEDWEGQFGEEDEDCEDMEPTARVKAAYDEIIELCTKRNGGACQII